MTNISISEPFVTSGSVYVVSTNPKLPVVFNNQADPELTLLLRLAFQGASGGFRIDMNFTITNVVA